MKQFLLILALIVFVAACSTQKSAVNVTKNDSSEGLEDSTEYDVETFDLKFENWYDLNNKPSKYRSQQYYESWNHQYVTAWNAKCARAGQDWHFEPVVGYDPNEDYGFDMNHKLFYYFMYVENVLKIKIIPHGPSIYDP
ncbi:DUF6146 family protein [Maribellus mangrovi]|uniref:DUF6146 family protein n=1 Tax=Maribellus mangrovi TaxID=3133146 RepID=UPI0030ECBC81